MMSGVLRQDTPGSGWYFVDGAHAVVGLGTITSYADHISVQTTPADTIYTWLCNADETYAPLGYSCGISAKLDHIDIYFGRDGHSVDPASIAAGPYANFWIFGVTS